MVSIKKKFINYFSKAIVNQKEITVHKINPMKMVVNSVDMFVNRCWLHIIVISKVLNALSFGANNSVSIKFKRKGQTFDERVAADTHTPLTSSVTSACSSKRVTLFSLN